ncbi:hypothetical protein Asppvi_004465 [Aspergillus pseudoviridinutans]|uniref:Uncharacterized protein n=1 Tax=Aspergillus pseudoviridinutans TaxID=1517512 RepID=A0A9P3B6H3_9EURO|nr:uncharacterized protein Asppvi_004465 [Aspergillus pseudoviridinutans]GIJ85606.1 hypothetical protein Asppvi_004465 [Aspergillus pseudoviridinutans]
MLNIAYSLTPSLVGDRLSCEKIALSPSRETYTKTEPRHVQRTLAVIKQVCGGFGTGYCDSWVMAEENIITIMANAAAAHQSHHPMVPISKKRADIHNAAAEMVALMRDAVSDAVEFHLSRISSHLFAASVKLTWHPLKNNCQTFCNLLLQAKHFNTVHPPFVTSGNQLPGFGDLESPYLHSFASSTHFPLFAEQKDLDKALRHSDVGAYMSSFHNTADLVSFAFGRKIIFDFRTPHFEDPVLCKQCVSCDHKLPQSSAFEELADLIRLSDHVLDDPFGAVTLLACHLDRPRPLYVDKKGWAWHGSESQRRRRWAENRIHVLAALNVFLSFTKSVFIASYLLVQGKPKEEVRFRVADSNVAGRAVYKTAREDCLDWSDDWEMQPVRLPSGSVRRRLQATLVWAMSSGSAGRATWRQCPCRYCGMNDDQLDEICGRGG